MALTEDAKESFARQYLAIGEEFGKGLYDSCRISDCGRGRNARADDR